MYIFNRNIIKFGTITPAWLIIIFDLLLSFFSIALAFMIRFDIHKDKNIWNSEWSIIKYHLLFFFILKFLVFYFFKIHKGLLRHTSNHDLTRIFKSLSVFSLFLYLLGILRYHYFDSTYLFPRSIIVLEFCISLFLLFGSRLMVKIVYQNTIQLYIHVNEYDSSALCEGSYLISNCFFKKSPCWYSYSVVI